MIKRKLCTTCWRKNNPRNPREETQRPQPTNNNRDGDDAGAIALPEAMGQKRHRDGEEGLRSVCHKSVWVR